MTNEDTNNNESPKENDNQEQIPEKDPKELPKDETDELIQQVTKLSLDDSKKDKAEEEDDEVPPEIQQLADWILKSRKILIVAGAGMSVAAGIPDFRTPGTGLYDNLQRYNLPYAEAIFDIEFYRHKPQPFVTLCRSLWPSAEEGPSPTWTHCFLTLLARHDRLLRVFTQNIDGLEVMAGLPTDKVVECHGHFRTASCIECGADYDIDQCRNIIMGKQKGKEKNSKLPPQCKKCGGNVKPDIVFFGQGMPDAFFKHMQPDTKSADLCWVIGTSLMVAPVGTIPEFVSCQRRVLMNRESVGDFGTRKHDLECLGNCDDMVQQLAKVLGWDEELKELYESTR